MSPLRRPLVAYLDAVGLEGAKRKGQLELHSDRPTVGCRRAPMPSLAPPTFRRHRDEGCSAAQRAEVKRIAGIVQGQPRATARLLGCSRTRVLAVPPLLLTRVTGRKQRRSSLFPRCFFSPLATRMDPYGPYGPIWTRILFYMFSYDLYMFATLFYMIIGGFIHDVMYFDIF